MRKADSRRRFLSNSVLTLIATQLGLFTSAEAVQPSQLQLPVEGQMPALSGASGWLNSAPQTAASLRGKVVLVEFWTYTCVNWRRTLPYVRAWAEKYKDHGLTVIGVHTPEFSFERDVENIRWAVKDMRIDYPVAIDSDYEIWRAFNNEYWPALYFIDTKGRIRHHQFGEGEYAESERIIQQLLTEAGDRSISHQLVSVAPEGLEVGADLKDLWSPENYVGYQQTRNFASPGGTVRDRSHVYVGPEKLELNSWSLAGNWTVGKEVIMLNQSHGRIAYCFHARDLNLVMGPRKRGASVRFRVLIDGSPPASDHGVDVDSQGSGTVIEQRLYQLIRQQESITDRKFEIEFLDSEVEVFDFTFG